MGAGDVAGDRQSEASPALVLIARGVETKKWTEDILTRGFRNARPVVVDGDHEALAIEPSHDVHPFPKAPGVGEEVGNESPEGIGFHFCRQAVGSFDSGLESPPCSRFGGCKKRA